jgi:hypothetical protein
MLGAGVVSRDVQIAARHDPGTKMGYERARKNLGRHRNCILAAHPGELQLIAPAGTVVIFNGHSGTAGRATAPAGRDAHCTRISPAAATRSNSTRRSRSARKRSRA